MKFNSKTVIFSFVLALIMVSGAYAADIVAPPRHDFPKIGAYEVLSCDFHMHTKHSDGKVTTRQRVEESYSMGYDAIALADHASSPKTYRVGKMIGDPLGLIIIPGFETGVKGNEHFLVLGVPSWFQSRDSHKWAEKTGEATAFYQDEMKSVAEAGGIMTYNHPHAGYRDPVKWGIKEGMLISIEVKNDVVGNKEDKWHVSNFHGIYCYPDAFDFALENNLAMLANTDAHNRRAANSSRTLVFVTERSANGVVDGLKARRTVAWFNGILWGREALLNSLIKSTVQVKRSANGQIELVNQGPVTLKGTIEGDGSAVELAPYAAATVDTTINTRRVSIVWSNIWINPRENLKTNFALYM